jgi:predicted MFS family arabinose efflux permease
VHAGYSAAFLTLAAVATAGACVFFFGMPETKARPAEETESQPRPRSAASLRPVV